MVADGRRGTVGMGCTNVGSDGAAAAVLKPSDGPCAEFVAIQWLAIWLRGCLSRCGSGGTVCSSLGLDGCRKCRVLTISVGLWLCGGG